MPLLKETKPNQFLANSQLYFKQFSSAWVHGLIVKTILFQAIHFFFQTLLIQLTQFRISIDFLYTQINVQKFHFKQFSSVSVGSLVLFKP